MKKIWVAVLFIFIFAITTVNAQDTQELTGITGIGVEISSGALSIKNWKEKRGTELKILPIGLFAEVNRYGYGNVYGLVLQPATLTRYIKKSKVVYPYISGGVIGGFVRGESSWVSTTIWLYGFKGAFGVAGYLEPVEVSLDFYQFSWIKFSVEDIGGVSGFIPGGMALSVHFFF